MTLLQVGTAIISPKQIDTTGNFLINVGENWGVAVMIGVLCILVVGSLFGLYIWKGMPAMANRKASLSEYANKKYNIVMEQRLEKIISSNEQLADRILKLESLAQKQTQKIGSIITRRK